MSKRNVDADNSEDVTPQRTILAIAPPNLLFALAKQEEKQNDGGDKHGNAQWHRFIDTHLALVDVTVVTLDAETAQRTRSTKVTALNVRGVLVVGLRSTEAIREVWAPFKGDVVLRPRNAPVA